jgi:hypothetical protein
MSEINAKERIENSNTKLKNIIDTLSKKLKDMEKYIENKGELKKAYDDLIQELKIMQTQIIESKKKEELKSEEKRVEMLKKLEAARLAGEEKAAEEKRLAEEKRVAEANQKAEEEKRLAEEKQKAEEKRLAEEQSTETLPEKSLEELEKDLAKKKRELNNFLYGKNGKLSIVESNEDTSRRKAENKANKEKPEKDINDTNTQSEKNKLRAEKDILIKKYIDEIEEERKAATKKRDTLLNEIKEIEDKIKKPKQPPSYSNRKSEKPFPRKGGPPIGRPPNGGKKTMKKRK